MIISDLEHLEVVREENRIEGGGQTVSSASASSSGASDDFGSVFTSNRSSSSAFQQPFVIFSGRFGFPIVVGTTTQTSASAFSSGSTSPFF